MVERIEDLREVAQHLEQVQWHDGYFSACCPFHCDERPSMLVNSHGFKCMSASCGEHGSLSKLMKRTGSRIVPTRTTYLVNWKEIVGQDGDYLETFVEVAHESARQLSEALTWYERRGLLEQVEPLHLGWWRGWYVTPVYSPNGGVVSVVLRAGPTVEKFTSSKYLVPPGTGVLYVPDWNLLEQQRTLFVPFGVYDAPSIVKLRLAAATWLPAPLETPPEALEFFRGNICVVPDKGEEAKGRVLAMSLGTRGQLAEMHWPAKMKDPNDFLKAKRDKDLLAQLGRYV